MAEIIRDANEAKIVIHHVYRVPSGYHYSGKSFEEFAKIMKKNAEEKMDKLLKEAKIDSSNSKPIYTLDKKDNTVKKISKLLRKRKYI